MRYLQLKEKMLILSIMMKTNNEKIIKEAQEIVFEIYEELRLNINNKNDYDEVF